MKNFMLILLVASLANACDATSEKKPAEKRVALRLPGSLGNVESLTVTSEGGAYIQTLTSLYYVRSDTAMLVSAEGGSVEAAAFREVILLGEVSPASNGGAYFVGVGGNDVWRIDGTIANRVRISNARPIAANSAGRQGTTAATIWSLYVAERKLRKTAEEELASRGESDQ